MPQPFKHRKTHVYYYRKAVPQHLREALGRTEFRISLGTKDLREAKRRYPEKAAEVDAIIAQASGGPVTLTHKQVIALAGLWYIQKLREYDENPGDPLGWEMWADELRETYLDKDRIHDVVRAEADKLAKAERLVLDERSRKALEEQLLGYAIDLTDTLIKRADGDYRPDPLVERFPEWRRLNDTTKVSDATSITELFNAWAVERRFAPKTRYSWERIIKKLTTHVGHENAANIADTDVISWKDALVVSGLSPKTVSNHLTVIKTFFRWAAKNKRITKNPAADVEYRAKLDPATARQSYTDADATRILAAARLEKEAHKRWVPWLAAFTGARCDELCGAMAADVRAEDGIPVIKIDPANREEGGSVKNVASIRSVPLHPALIAEGFLSYVESVPSGGPLFPKLTPDRFGKRGGNGSKTIGRWVREKVGITDSRKAPNHSWRHRFADQCKKVGIPRELRFALEGHASSDVGDAYGSEGYPLHVLSEAVSKLPNPVIRPAEEAGPERREPATTGPPHLNRGDLEPVQRGKQKRLPE